MRVIRELRLVKDFININKTKSGLKATFFENKRKTYNNLSFDFKILDNYS